MDRSERMVLARIIALSGYIQTDIVGIATCGVRKKSEGKQNIHLQKEYNAYTFLTSGKRLCTVSLLDRFKFLHRLVYKA